MTRRTIYRWDGAADAYRELQQAFNDWSASLTTHSVQATFAIIAANWAVHTSKDAILNNVWSKWSMLTALSFLGINLLATGIMAYMHYKRCLYADNDTDRWEKEFQASSRTKYWPYTKCIESLGHALRCLKTVLPFVAAAFFVVSLLAR
jgi:hypothetical protein